MVVAFAFIGACAPSETFVLTPPSGVGWNEVPVREISGEWWAGDGALSSDDAALGLGPCEPVVEAFRAYDTFHEAWDDAFPFYVSDTSWDEDTETLVVVRVPWCSCLYEGFRGLRAFTRPDGALHIAAATSRACGDVESSAFLTAAVDGEGLEPVTARIENEDGVIGRY